MLNSVWLDTFVTLCEVGHFTRAAAALNMTQPGVSQHLRKLEQQVGEPLLSRDGKSFVPTPAGESVLAIGRRRREEERQLRQALQQDDPDSGEASAACSPGELRTRTATPSPSGTRAGYPVTVWPATSRLTVGATEPSDSDVHTVAGARSAPAVARATDAET